MYPTSLHFVMEEINLKIWRILMYETVVTLKLELLNNQFRGDNTSSLFFFVNWSMLHKVYIVWMDGREYQTTDVTLQRSLSLCFIFLSHANLKFKLVSCFY